MKKIKYLIEFIFIYLLFIFFKIIGYEKASDIGEKLGKKLGPYFRSNRKIRQNLEDTKNSNIINQKDKIISSMWGNYGRILSEYPFIKDFKEEKLSKYIKIVGNENLNLLKKRNRQAVFVSGHFNNFELMAMQIEKNDIKLAAIYRPLNNIFLNKVMEDIRKKYICKNQIKKGKSGIRNIINLVNQGFSIALMIDQRVSEGIKSNFFGRKAFTTTIPAQLIRKYDLDVIPVYIERIEKKNFKVTFYKAISFDGILTKEEITHKLNVILENMILKNPDQWIWSHNRWK